MGNWKNIRLELGRTKDFPAGSVSRGYLIRLPINGNDNVDMAALALNPHRATVQRYWSTEPDETGLVLPVGERWAMRCEGKPDRLLQLDGGHLRLDQQVMVVEPDGAVLPFRIASIH